MNEWNDSAVLLWGVRGTSLGDDVLLWGVRGTSLGDDVLLMQCS